MFRSVSSSHPARPPLAVLAGEPHDDMVPYSIWGWARPNSGLTTTARVQLDHYDIKAKSQARDGVSSLVKGDWPEELPICVAEVIDHVEVVGWFNSGSWKSLPAIAANALRVGQHGLPDGRPAAVGATEAKSFPELPTDFATSAHSVGLVRNPANCQPRSVASQTNGNASKSDELKACMAALR